MLIESIKLTLQLALVSTCLLLIICIPLAWWLLKVNGFLGIFIETLLGLPLVLPPTVLGFYLLVLLNPEV